MNHRRISGVNHTFRAHFCIHDGHSNCETKRQLRMLGRWFYFYCDCTDNAIPQRSGPSLTPSLGSYTPYIVA